MAERIGKYEVIDQIGRGGMGTIYRALDPILQRPVALKVISNLEVTPELRARFFREAQACARIAHPNIVIVHDMGEDNGRLFIVMELLEGEELRHIIGRPAQLGLRDKLDIVRQICEGLHFAHQKGVVHRDIKPANILVLRNGQVKILDFGIAQIAGVATQRDLTRTGAFMGTLRYMAPEQVRGQADRRSDIFSVGAVSYELLGRRPPFAGDDPLQILEQLRTTTPARLTELDPGLPSALADVIERALQKDPAARFADLGEMGQQVEALRRELAAGAVDDARPLAPPSPRTVAPAPVAATTPGTPATDHGEPARLPRQLDHDAAHETDREPVGRVPRIAIGTGVALVAVVVVVLYLWWPAASRVARVDTPSPAASSVGAAAPAVEPAAAPEAKVAAPEVRAATPQVNTAAPDVKTAVTAEPTREGPVRDAERARAISRPPASTTPAPAAVKPDATSAPLREDDRTRSVAAAPSSARDEAEQARQRMIAARQAAERVAAGFYARRRFGSAQGKEREGLAALGKSDYAAAAALFAAAQAEYQAAAVEAPREEENERQLARLRTSLDQAHAAATARRQQALAAGADQLARDLFDQAQARQVEGDGLASRKDLVAAARAYQDAAARYAEATARARAARPAR
jgi:serine/threonine-protein kinase